MTGFMTYGNKKFEHLDSQMRKLLPSLYKASKDLLPLVDADAMAFSDYMVLPITNSLHAHFSTVLFTINFLCCHYFFFFFFEKKVR